MSGAAVPVTHPQPATQLHFIPHASAIVCSALLIVTLTLMLWSQHVRFVGRCTCQGKDEDG